MNAGVASRGSPTPRSMISIPRAAAAVLACVSRTNGYVPCASRSGLTFRSAIEAPQQLVAAHQRGHLDLLVASVGEGGFARAEVDRVDPREDELGDRRPRLLGRDLDAPRAAALSTCGPATVTGPDGACPSMTSSPCGSHSARSHASASCAAMPGG